jgi:glutaredoxin
MPEVTIYTKPGCPYCAKAKEHYKSIGVDFAEINVYEVPGAKDKAIKLAGKALVPVIVEGDKITVGFDGGG